MDSILQEITRERARQDEMHGGPDHDDDHHPGDWCLLLAKYVGQAAAATIDSQPGGEFREQMIKIAAVAVAATQSFDRARKLP